MRIALFGGTFNPIHGGHLLLAESAREQFHLQRVIFVPTGQPPHKAAPSTSAAHRLSMVRWAIRGNPAFQVSDWEIRRKRVVYTYETLDYFHRRFPKARLFFLVGSDSLQQIRSWRQGERLLTLAHFLVAERPESLWTSLPLPLRRKTRRVNSPSVSFASHDIRRRVLRRHSIRYQVPAAVERYIQRHGLYRKPE